MNITLIGCGGVGSYLAPPLARTMKHALKSSTLVLMDGDIVTSGNIDRQLFDERDIGKAKVIALWKRLRQHEGGGFTVKNLAEFFTPNFNHALLTGTPDLLILAVDNHAARKAALDDADRYGFSIIVAANESEAAEAYIYRPEWKGHPNLDPRIKSPEILTDTSDDPTHPEGCTGDEALEAAPQTSEANFMAAAFALRIFGAHFLKAVGEEYRKFLPARIESNFSSVTTRTVDEESQIVSAA